MNVEVVVALPALIISLMFSCFMQDFVYRNDLGGWLLWINEWIMAGCILMILYYIGVAFG